MAEGSQQRGVTAAFPPPPPFWRWFTSANLEALEENKAEVEKKEGQKRHWSPETLQALQLPDKLQFLVPPAQPGLASTYSLFGETQNASTALPSLQEQGIEQLFQSAAEGDGRAGVFSSSRPINHAHYLLKISKSLLLNFLEFVGILALSPERFGPKLEDIRNLFINAHHLLNLYRPHQARESLLLMMEEQLDNTRQEIEQMDQLKEKVGSFLQQLQSDGDLPGDDRRHPLGSGDVPTQTLSDDDGRVVEEARKTWKLFQNISYT